MPTATCPSCKTVLKVPQNTPVQKIVCPKCKRPLSGSRTHVKPARSRQPVRDPLAASSPTAVAPGKSSSPYAVTMTQKSGSKSKRRKKAGRSPGGAYDLRILAGMISFSSLLIAVSLLLPIGLYLYLLAVKQFVSSDPQALRAAVGALFENFRFISFVIVFNAVISAFLLILLVPYFSTMAYSNTKRLGVTGQNYRLSTTLLMWFVPVANMILPFFVTAETYKASLHHKSKQWKNKPFPAELIAWCGTLVAGFLLPVFYIAFVLGGGGHNKVFAHVVLFGTPILLTISVISINTAFFNIANAQYAASSR